jgi:mono/diheme cytochrome c family protein
MQLLRLWFVLPALLIASTVHAADADSGKRLAQTRCVPCHVVVPHSSREVADAPPFDVIATKFRLGPDVLAFHLLHPHPRMNVPLTRDEAEDIAAYISTLSR